MHDRVDAGDGIGERIGIEDRPFDEVQVDAIEVGAVPGGEVVDADDLMAAVGEA